jgi:hypothetical protein
MSFNKDLFYKELGALLDKHGVKSIVGLYAQGGELVVTNICQFTDTSLIQLNDAIQDALGAFVEGITQQKPEQTMGIIEQDSANN